MGNALLIYTMVIKSARRDRMRQMGQSAWANSILIVQHVYQHAHYHIICLLKQITFYRPHLFVA